jgi:prepilin-type processing-associated H-X9-DG protein
MNGQGDATSQAYSAMQSYTIFRKTSSILNPSPSAAWVFLDENADSINDGFFYVQMRTAPLQWYDRPASYHGKSSTFAFADGHSEFKVWKDANIANVTIKRQILGAYTPFATADSSGDLQWLQARTTSK